eukprot:g4347.t1
MENYEVGRATGKGKFATVYWAKRKGDGIIVALKRLAVPVSDDDSRTTCMREVRLLQSLNHCNIIRVVDFFLERGFEKDDRLVIAFEWAAAGDLKRQLRKALQRETHFTERTIWGYFSQICGAISYMHKQRIIHRDLKPANIFLTLEGQIKVGDLGLGRLLTKTDAKETLAHSRVGTPLYMSPEVLRGRGYSWKSDVWSLGCILYELAMLRSPFLCESPCFFTLVQKIGKGTYPPLLDYYSSDLRALVEDMINIIPAKRPNAERAHAAALGNKEKIDRVGQPAIPPTTAAHLKLKTPATEQKSEAANDGGVKHEHKGSNKDTGTANNDHEHAAAEIRVGQALPAGHVTNNRPTGGGDGRSGDNMAATDGLPVSRTGVGLTGTDQPSGGGGGGGAAAAAAAAVTVTGDAKISSEKLRPEQYPTVVASPLLFAAGRTNAPPPSPLPGVVTNTSGVTLRRVRRAGRLSAKAKAAMAAAAVAAAAAPAAPAAAVATAARAELSAAARPKDITPCNANGARDPRWAELVDEAMSERKKSKVAPVSTVLGQPPPSGHERPVQKHEPVASSRGDTKKGSQAAVVPNVATRGGTPLPAVVVDKRTTSYNTTTSVMTATSSSSPTSARQGTRRGRRPEEKHRISDGGTSSGCSRTRGEEGGGDEGRGNRRGTGKERNDDVEMMMTAETNSDGLKNGDDGDDDGNQDGHENSARRRAEERRERRRSRSRRSRSDRDCRSARHTKGRQNANGGANGDNGDRSKPSSQMYTAGGDGEVEGVRLEREETKATAASATKPERGRGTNTPRRRRQGRTIGSMRAYAASDATAVAVTASAAAAAIAGAVEVKERSVAVFVVPSSEDRYVSSVFGKLTIHPRRAMPMAGEPASPNRRRVGRCRGRGGRERTKASGQGKEDASENATHSGAVIDNCRNDKVANLGSDKEGRRKNSKAASAPSYGNSSTSSSARVTPDVVEVMAAAALVSSSAVYPSSSSSFSARSSPTSSGCSCPSDCPCHRHPSSNVSSCPHCLDVCSCDGEGGGGVEGEEPQASTAAAVTGRTVPDNPPPSPVAPAVASRGRHGDDRGAGGSGGSGARHDGHVVARGRREYVESELTRLGGKVSGQLRAVAARERRLNCSRPGRGGGGGGEGDTLRLREAVRLLRAAKTAAVAEIEERRHRVAVLNDELRHAEDAVAEVNGKLVDAADSCSDPTRLCEVRSATRQLKADIKAMDVMIGASWALLTAKKLSRQQAAWESEEKAPVGGRWGGLNARRAPSRGSTRSLSLSTLGSSQPASSVSSGTASPECATTSNTYGAATATVAISASRREKSHDGNGNGVEGECEGGVARSPARSKPATVWRSSGSTTTINHSGIGSGGRGGSGLGSRRTSSVLIQEATRLLTSRPAGVGH